VLIERIAGEVIHVDLVLDPLAGACHVDPAQFGSALLNLAINARDAMPLGGQLTIRSTNILLDLPMAAQYPDAVPGEYVIVEVTDTGSGMAPEVLERAVEPFFTTKELGKGTGLGLSQVHGFVRQSGGFLTLESSVGVGTTVRIHLRRAAVAAPPSLSATSVPSDAGLVLVVEDDPDVRNLVLAQLESLGYETLAAANGPEALQLVQDTNKSVDLLLTDMVMPGGMNGGELIRAARTVRPGLPAVLVSGYTAGNVLNSLEEAGDPVARLPVLSKPYSLEELARVLAQVRGQS
jgi:two-component system, chemotaxis family, CheB/CheR fusion protein